MLFECKGLEGTSGCKDTSPLTLTPSHVNVNPQGYGKLKWVRVKDMTQNNNTDRDLKQVIRMDGPQWRQ